MQQPNVFCRDLHRLLAEEYVNYDRDKQRFLLDIAARSIPVETIKAQVEVAFCDRHFYFERGVTQFRKKDAPFFTLNPWDDQEVYLRIPHFGWDPKLSPECIATIRQGLMNRRNAVIDLRGNPGGGIAAVLLTLGLFIDELELSYIPKAKNLDSYFFHLKNCQLTSLVSSCSGETVSEVMAIDLIAPVERIVVLVNQNSASGSEIFAHFIQKKIGSVLGIPTAGILNTNTSHYEGWNLWMPTHRAYVGGDALPERVYPNKY